MTRRILLAFGVWLVLGSTGRAQTEAVDRYLTGLTDLQSMVESGTLTGQDIDDNLMPLSRPGRFVAYARDSQQPDFRSLVASLDGLRLNKLVGASGGSGGGTSLVSKVAVPAVVGVGIEYGGILQRTSGTVTTLRANLLGLSNLVTGARQFCFELNTGECGEGARWLRRFSGSVAFELVTGEARDAESPVPVGDLFASDYRMTSWGARVDLTGSNNLDDPGYLRRWNQEIGTLAGSFEANDLTEAINAFFAGTDEEPEPETGDSGLDLYIEWRMASRGPLLSTTDFGEFKRRLAERLDVLLVLLREQRDFNQRFLRLDRAHANYFAVRDDLIRDLHAHKASLEYVNARPLDQPTLSTLRFVYSHQPTGAPVVLTANVAGSFYSSSDLPEDTGRWRDVQVSGQLDRRLGALGDAGYLVLTLAGYYQWMKEDALLTIPAGTTAPGTPIELPGEASTLLGTKGHIGVLQGKLTLPVSDTVKVPLSVSWSNRTELITESDVRGQIGLTLDVDGLFR